MTVIRLTILSLVLLSQAWAQTGAQTTGSTLPTYNISLIAGDGISGNKNGATTVAEFARPLQLAVDMSGNLYVADSENQLVRMISGQTVSTLAGSGVQGSGCDGAANNANAPPAPITATSANLNDPTGVIVDGSGIVYVGDSGNDCVRKISGGMATRYAGRGQASSPNGQNGDGGPALLAYTGGPAYLAFDSMMDLFMTDQDESLVREVMPSLTITTAAGGMAQQPLVQPAGIAVDQQNNLYVMDQSTGIVKMVKNQVQVPFAGFGAGGSLAENIPALQADLIGATAIAFDPQGNLLIADTINCRIRRVVGGANGMIQTIAGIPGTNPLCGYGPDTITGSVVSATNSLLDHPQGIAVDAKGNIYISDSTNNRIRMLTPTAPAVSTTCNFSVTPTSDSVGATAGSDHFMVTATGGTATGGTTGSTCAWNATTSATWITGLPPSGTGSQTVNFSYAANMSSQSRMGTITVAGSGSSTGGSSATFTETQAGASCNATFSPTGPVIAPAAGTMGMFSIMFAGNDCPWQAVSTASWLSITSGSSGTGNGMIGYTAAANMAATPLVGSILAASTPFVVLEQGAAPMAGCTAMFSPAPPAMAASTAGTGSIGVSFPTGAQNCSYNATASASWITISSGATGNGNGSVGYSLAANSTTAARSGSVVISGQPYTILQAGGAPSSQCTVMFSAASPVNVSASGGTGTVGVSFPTSSCPWTASSNVSWITLTSGASGTGNGTIGYTVAPNTATTQSGTITVTETSLTITEAGGIAVCNPASFCPAIASVVSASAYGDASTAAPGSIVEVYGSNLANGTQMWASQNFNGANAPTSLGGVTVTFNGQPGYVSYISPLQVNVQIPTTAPTGMVQVVVDNNGEESQPYSMTLDAVQPGLLAPQSFVVNGNSYVVALLPNGAYVLPPGAIPGLNSQEAPPGAAITMYGIGMGAALDATGQPVGGGQMASGLSSIASPVEVQFAGTPAVVTYAGLAPGYVGLYQINVVAPQIADSDLVPLTFTLNGSSNQSLFTAVHQ